MSLLEYYPDKRYIHSDYITSYNKDLLIIWFYANDPTHSDPIKRLTLKHFAAIQKASYVRIDLTYIQLTINLKRLQNYVLFINNLINDINHYLSKILLNGMSLNEREKNKQMLAALKEEYPDLTEAQLEDGYELASFLETLKGAIIYEEEYLDNLYAKFMKVPEPIKNEFLNQII